MQFFTNWRLPAISTLMLFTLNIACSKEQYSVKDIAENSNKKEENNISVSVQNLTRAINIFDRSLQAFFSDDQSIMYRYYNPFTKIRSEEKASVWMYTASIEAVNSILKSLNEQHAKGQSELYNQHYNRYVDILAKLYDNADFYTGTFKLTSYTQEKEWSIYAVDRANERGQANVTGVLNVYDDQMWLTYELLESYHLTNNEDYLKKAEYLTNYVLDGWDCTLNEQGLENGGITWGPGYTTKHSCSNSPIISPLVSLYEIYKDKNDQIEHRYIDSNDRQTRLSKMEKKSTFYLDFAKKIYQWQKKNLLTSDGVYDDFMGGCENGDCNIKYETIGGITYRKNTILKDHVGPAYSYNTGTMISGAADLYKASQSAEYLNDGKNLSDDSFSYFAKLGAQIPSYYTFATTDFNNWFNGILLKGYLHIYPQHNQIEKAITSFQKNLDYGYDRFLKEDLLPTDLLTGWSDDQNSNNVQGMIMFSFANQYALLAQYDITKSSK